MWYTVKAGDSLSKLAQEHLGNMMDYMLIFEANKDVLSNPDNVPIGAKIWIPVGGAAKPTLENKAIFSASGGGFSLPKLTTNQMLLWAGVGMFLIAGSMALKKLRKA